MGNKDWDSNCLIVLGGMQKVEWALGAVLAVILMQVTSQELICTDDLACCELVTSVSSSPLLLEVT